MDIKEKFRNMKVEKRAYINGKYVECKSKKTIEKYSSFDGMDLSGISACGKEDVEDAVQCAKKAFELGTWEEKIPEEKKNILLRFADLLEDCREELAILDTVETSRAYQNYYYDSIPKAIGAIRYFAESIDKYYDNAIPPRKDTFATITRCPLGVVGIITPWNDPMVVAAWKFSPALLMGNSVIIKPAEQSSLSMIRVAEIASEAGIPKGVFNVLPGYGEETGKALALHTGVQGIFFTGSSAVGKQIVQYSGMSNMKKVGLECGGKSPFIVSKNCKDLREAAKVLAKNVFYNQGQICSAPSRVIVERAVRNKFMELLEEESEKFVPGNPYEIRNNVGCIVSKEQYEKVKTYIELAKRNGATIYQAKTVKEKPVSACCIQPTIISGVENSDKVAQEEIFGPVVVLLEAENIQEAVKIANDTPYGLAGAVFTDDLNEAYYAAKRIESGLVHINSYGEDDNMAPFGGFKESGMGKDKSLWAFDEYSQQKTVWMKFKMTGNIRG